MKRLGLLFLLVFAVSGVEVAAQDKYPSKPIKVVVPFGPGSATDIVMRIVGEHMRPILGQPVVIENKPGAFGILAIEEMARSRPDGYTLQIGNPGTNVLAPIIYKKKFKIDYDKEVILVTRLSEVPLVLGATTKDFPPKTYAEFIAYAKANPGKVRYASVGIGSNNHYDMEAFAQWAGIVLAHLPNKGGGAAITNDLVTGDAHVALLNAASSMGVVKAGQVRGAGGDVRPARARIRRRAHPHRARLCQCQGPVVGVVCARRHAARRAGNRAQGRRAGAQLRPGGDSVQAADDQACSERVEGRRASLGQGRGGVLEEGHRRGEGRAAGLSGAGAGA